MMDAILALSRDKMRKSLEVTKNDLSSIRSGRATPALVEHIVIPAYGGTQRMKLLEMATITVPDAKSLLVQPYDPSQVSDIVKGVQNANIGLNPVPEGEAIRIMIPSLSQEQREEYLKLARTKLEAGRIMIRQVRQEAIKDLRRDATDGNITEDQTKIGERKIQELTDEMVAEIDQMGEKKETELMQV